MNPLRRVLFLSTLLLSGFAARAIADMTPTASTPATGDNTPIATIGSSVVTEKQMDDAIAPQLVDIQHQIYKIKKTWLRQQAKQVLFTQAAAASGKSLQDWQQSEITSQIPPPSQAEIDKAVKQYFPNGPAPSTTTLQQLTQYLTSQNAAAREQVVYQKLAAKTPVTINLVRPAAKRLNVTYAPDDPSKGPKNAPVTIVEFTDYQCPYCKHSQPTLKQVEEAYKGKIKIVTREFPLPMHDRAKPAAEAALCAWEQGKYWEYREVLFPSTSMTDDDFKRFAKEVGLNQKKFETCLAENRYASRIDKDIADGKSFGTTGTPQFFVNGESLVGAQPFDDFQDAIDAALDEVAKNKKS